MAGALATLLKCSVCLGDLTRPKLLQCSHSFCLSCLQSLPKSNMTISCPTCRQETDLPSDDVTDLKDDFRFNQMKEAFSHLEGDTERMCSICRKVVSAVDCVYCVQCNKKMCGQCLQKHNKMDDFSDHTLLKDVKKCSKHQDPCIFLCMQCKKLVCLACRMDCCAEHDVKEIGKEVRRYVEKLNNGELSDILEVYFSYVEAQHRSHYEHLEEQIDEHTKKVMILMMNRQNQLKQDLVQRRQDHGVMLQKERARLESEIRALHNLDIKFEQGIGHDLIQRIIDSTSSNYIPVATKERHRLEQFYSQTSIDIGSIEPSPTSLVIYQFNSCSRFGDKGYRFILDKIIYIKEFEQEVFTGNWRDIIIQMDIKTQEDSIMVRFYKQQNEEYLRQSNLLIKNRCIKTQDYYSKQMNFLGSQIRQLLQFKFASDKEWNFDKIVPEKRDGIVALVAQIESLIIVCEYKCGENHHSRQCVIHVDKSDSLYKKEAALLAKSERLSDGRLAKEIQYMKEQIIEFVDHNEIGLECKTFSKSEMDPQHDIVVASSSGTHKGRKRTLSESEGV